MEVFSHGDRHYVNSLQDVKAAFVKTMSQNCLSSKKTSGQKNAKLRKAHQRDFVTEVSALGNNASANQLNAAHFFVHKKKMHIRKKFSKKLKKRQLKKKKISKDSFSFFWLLCHKM